MARVKPWVCCADRPNCHHSKPVSVSEGESQNALTWVERLAAQVEQVEEELWAECALADKLADALRGVYALLPDGIAYMPADEALAAYDEARNA